MWALDVILPGKTASSTIDQIVVAPFEKRYGTGRSFSRNSMHRRTYGNPYYSELFND
jgi:hypothetical protein